MKNDYKVNGDITTIYINSKKYGRFETLIDTEDLQKARMVNSWAVAWGANVKSFYVVGTFKQGGKSVSIRLARLVMNLNNPKLQVDHQRHATLDNRKSQLRIVTNAENCQNRRIRTEKGLGMTGVIWDKKNKKFQAHIRANNKTMHLGYYSVLSEAVLARVKAIEEYYPYKQSIQSELPITTSGEFTWTPEGGDPIVIE